MRPDMAEAASKLGNLHMDCIAMSVKLGRLLFKVEGIKEKASVRGTANSDDAARMREEIAVAMREIEDGIQGLVGESSATRHLCVSFAETVCRGIPV